jgi:hypothetical protein
VNLMKRVRERLGTIIIITYVLIFSHMIYSSIFNVVREGGCLCRPSLQCLSYKHLVSRSMHFPRAFISGKLHIILLWGPSQALELGAVRKLIP